MLSQLTEMFELCTMMGKSYKFICNKYLKTENYYFRSELEMSDHADNYV